MSQPPMTVLGEPTATHTAVDVPTRIGRFMVLRQIGAGGMGVVYSAYDEELDRRVAIKLLHGGLRDEQHSTGQARLLREAQAMARVAHPNVAAIYEVGLVRGQVFIAMELVHGQTLREWMKAKPRGWREVVRVFLQAAHGLLAAHERGIIHRDFKPENALIGDDGRVRVLDFSLARTSAGDSDLLDVDVPAGDVSLTHAGKIVGTPAYMAPEQALGVVADSRADQFSFCVALFEALYGRRPFVGQTSGELVEDIMRDKVVPTPGVRLPAWLVRALQRGLRPSPEQRWPGMTELVAELERDRGRWLRLASALLLAGVLASLVLGAIELRARWQRSAGERAAAERLAVLEASLDQALADGRRTEAAAALAAFTGAPEHRDTPALAAAYLGWSRRMQAAADLDAARLAAARAYAAASDEAGAQAALEQLAELFVAQGAWDAAALLVAELRDNRPELLASPVWVSIAGHAARRRRDFGEFAAQAAAPGAPEELAELAPVMASLSHGTASERVARQAFAIGDGATIGLFDRINGDNSVELVRADAGLSAAGVLTLAGHSFAGLAPQLRPGEAPVYLSHHGEAVPEVVVLAPEAGGLRELLRFASTRPLSGAVADLDGDGTSSLYLGTGPYRRELLALTPGPGGALQPSHPHRGTDAASSDVQAMFAADLDGDGRDELAVSAGPWNAFDLRIFKAGARAPELTLVARRKLGQMIGIGGLRGVDGRVRVVAAKIDSYPSRIVFPPDAPTGEPAGLYVLELRGDQIEVVSHQPWPIAPGEPAGVSMFAVGDVDGDGRDDAVTTLTLGDRSEPLLVVHRQLADGTLAAVDIAGLDGLLLGQFDADPAAELLVRVMPADPVGPTPLWVLGAGDTPVPALALARPEPASVPAAADPLVARTWHRAEQLASLGLLAEAGQTISELASLAHTPEVSDDARLRAAELYRRADQCARATALYAQVGERHQVEALQGLGDCHEREGRFAEALASVDALRARTDLDPALRAEVAARAEDLRPGSGEASLELPFDGRLDPGWQIVDKAALRQDLVTGGLAIDAIVNHGELARLPLRCDGQGLALSAELTVERSEWASGLEIALRSAGGAEDAIHLAVMTGGGGGVFDRSIRCAGPDGSHTLQVLRDTPPDTVGSYILEVEYRPALQRLVCAVTASDGVRRSSAFPVRGSLPTGDCELVLRARHIGFDSAFWTRVRLDALRVGGASLAAGRSGDDAGRRLVQGDAHGALALLDAGEPGDPLRAVWRAMTLAELGRWPQAANELQTARLEPGTPAWHALIGLLRTRVASFGPLTRGALGDRAFRLHAAAFVGVLRNHADDPRVQRTLAEPLSDPSEYTPEPGDRDGLLLRATFHLYRARMWIGAGALDRAEAALNAAISDLATLGPAGPSELPLYIRPAVLEPTLAAARGDGESARASIRAALEAEAAPEILRDVMRLQPLLRPLLEGM